MKKTVYLDLNQSVQPFQSNLMHRINTDTALLSQ